MAIPIFTDEDISWACHLLGLPERAFDEREGHDHGKEVLCLTSTADVAACPGSGKTTLLVAKLAMMARYWSKRHSGVCVLSHTNVARNEIAKRLSGKGVGEVLLSYPHFVGTIQAFVDEFLALPWLRSKGFYVQSIDDDRCEQHRRALLRRSEFRTLANAVRAKESSNERINIVRGWKLGSPQYDVINDDGQLAFGRTTPSGVQLTQLAARCAADGYFRYNEMFMWARDLIENVPGIVQAVRTRYPVLFLDEVQDNSDEQSQLLHELFMEGAAPVTRQRLGDANQSIFAGGAVPKNDPFPLSAIQRVIANSHRFGQEIASFADAFAVEPQDLVGHGPNDARIRADTDGKHTVFLFDEDAVARVIPEYANHLMAHFSSVELKIGTFTAVGAVHRPSPGKLAVGSFWPEYNHELTGSSPRLVTFVDSLLVGRSRALALSEAHPAAESLAAAVLQTARLEAPNEAFPVRRRQHRQLVELLRSSPDALRIYEELLSDLVVGLSVPDRASWPQQRRKVEAVVAKMRGRPVRSSAAMAFLAWPTTNGIAAGVEPSNSSRHTENVFQFQRGDASVAIRMGSIHSVKGETHTATLVLDVDYYGSQWKALKPWLLATKRGGRAEKARSQKRLREHYVAMTRPTHLLCLAMRFGDVASTEVEQLKARGWRICHVNTADAVWL